MDCCGCTTGENSKRWDRQLQNCANQDVLRHDWQKQPSCSTKCTGDSPCHVLTGRKRFSHRPYRCVAREVTERNQLPPRDGQAELAWVTGYIPRWFICPQTVTRPSTNPEAHVLTWGLKSIGDYLPNRNQSINQSINQSYFLT